MQNVDCRRDYREGHAQTLVPEIWRIAAVLSERQFSEDAFNDTLVEIRSYLADVREVICSLPLFRHGPDKFCLTIINTGQELIGQCLPFK